MPQGQWRCKSYRSCFHPGDAGVETANLATLNTFVLNESALRVLNKVKGLDNHGGQEVLAPSDPEYVSLANYLGDLSGQNLTAYAEVKSTLALESPMRLIAAPHSY